MKKAFFQGVTKVYTVTVKYVHNKDGRSLDNFLDAKKGELTDGLDNKRELTNDLQEKIPTRDNFPTVFRGMAMVKMKSSLSMASFFGCAERGWRRSMH
jgi:hypothetical protein